MGPYAGGQAVSIFKLMCVKSHLSPIITTQEYVKVPFADFNALKLPPGTEHEADFALLADIFPTVGIAFTCRFPFHFITGGIIH
jgi:hypothetical protein